MFDVHCPTHGSRVLLGSRSIVALANTDNGIVVRWRCHCGTTGTRRFGGRAKAHVSTPEPALGPAA